MPPTRPSATEEELLGKLRRIEALFSGAKTEGERQAAPARPPAPASPPRSSRKPHRKVGRNAPCPCGSGRKFERCCG